MIKSELMGIIEKAIEEDAKYIAVKVRLKDYEPEIIINCRNNFQRKMNYYNLMYDDNLNLLTNKEIKIVDASYGNISKITRDLKLENIWE